MTETETLISCYHCGLDCPNDEIKIEEKYFCCEGCKTVYSILDQNNLCNYYDLEKMNGNSPELAEFSFLDVEDISSKLLNFQNEEISKVSFYIPSIHCSSCLYLLENMYRINQEIKYSQVDFLNKTVNITFNHNKLSIRQLAELLTQLGYKPLLSPADHSKANRITQDRKLLTRLGVAGFCAGNIMLFSFPEYFGLEDSIYQSLFGYLNIALALPVVVYSASGYFESVYKSLQKGFINIDFPIMLSILVAFFRGIYEVVVNNGAGYFDSLTGLIFFLLIGKWFQQKTYNFLSFERDYKSYFPMAVTLLEWGQEKTIPIADLKKGDKIVVRNGELIPADSFLYKGNANIDFSFVTGESAIIHKNIGDYIYAGGRQEGEKLELEVLNDVSQSYLTQLWNTDTFKKTNESRIKIFSNLVGKYFTIGVLTLAFSVAFYWYWTDQSKMLNAFTAILIIACPCTLALSYPFALGNALRIFGKQNLYLKNGDIIEQMAHCDAIVFDKTGTITDSKESKVQFESIRVLSTLEENLLSALVRNSTHPIALKIRKFLIQESQLKFNFFKETPGLGIEGQYEGIIIKLGSDKLVKVPFEKQKNLKFKDSIAHLSFNDKYVGNFAVPNNYRVGIEKTITELTKKYDTYLLSGDNDAERAQLEKSFYIKKNLQFNFSPHDKLNFIKHLQEKGKKVLMIGDGLNDAGALKQADMGIVVTEDTLNFTPMSDGILKADQLKELPKYLEYSQFGMKLIQFSYGFSLMYNTIGLVFAVQGTLSPIVAAILMPLNSITLVSIASFGMIWKGKKLFSN
ncbi:MAG: heavy metal translocating P-type ATPase metal-binding domain-containing protein [Bacteroidota bacterium]